jgi:alpha-L-rhamnosidase
MTGIMLGHGWYAQPSVNVGPPSLFFTLNVHVVFANGTSGVITVVSDDTWTQSQGPITMDDIYNGLPDAMRVALELCEGETFDSRLVQPGWSLPGFDDSQWVAASVVAPPSSTVILSSHAIMPHVTIAQSYTPIQMWESAPGTWVFDFGQNMVCSDEKLLHLF